MQHITKSFVVATAGAIIVVCGFLLYFVLFPLIIDAKIKKAVVLEDGSEAFKRWEKPPPLDFSIYFFNVTNPDDIHNGAKPVLREVGPYVYTEYHNKEIIKYFDEDDTVSYSIRKLYFFNQEKSHCHRETDLVTILNPALMGTVLMVEKIFPFGLNYINQAIPYLFPSQKTIFITVTVHELLFSGLLINCSHGSGPGRMVCDGMKGRLPITIRELPNSPNYAFSYFYHKNNSLVGPFRISRGRNNVTQLGQIKMYEGKYKLNIWPKNSTCNIIRGTDSTVFAPFIKKTDSIFIFVPDVCGSMFAEFESEITLESVRTLRFVGSSKNFADPLKYEANKCHCDEVIGRSPVEDEVSWSCPKEGAMYITPCYKAPVVFSQPHFYMGDKEYLDYPLGLQPNKTKHETFVQIEPKTGAPVEGYKRLQMNMHLHSVPDIEILSNVSSGLLPLLWIEEGFKLDDGHLSLLVRFYHVLNVLNFFPWFLIFVGTVTFIISLIVGSSENNLISSVLNSVNKIKSVQNHVAESGIHSNENAQSSTVVKDDSKERNSFTSLAEYKNYCNNNSQ